MRNAREILALPPLDWIIEGILPARMGSIAVLGGKQKLGKSRLVTDLCFRGLRGKPAFGAFAMTLKRVLYVNAEGGEQAFRLRAPIFQDQPTPLLESLDIEGRPPSLTFGDGRVNPAVVMRLAALWAPYDLVVLDPLASMHCAEENDNTRMQGVLDGIREAAQGAGCGVLIVHHMHKPREGEDITSSYGLRGAVAIAAGVDAIILANPGARRQIKLNFELRHAEPHDEVVLEPDGLSGRYYRLDGDRRPDRADFASDWGPSETRYREAFGMLRAVA